MYGSCQANGRWLRLEFELLLKKLGSDEENQVLISFNSRARGTKYLLSGREGDVTEEDDAFYEEEDYWIRHIDPETLKKVCQWLEQDMDPLRFMFLLYRVAEEDFRLFGDKGRFSLDTSINQTEVWNGNFVEEFERLLRVYVDNNNNWMQDMIASVRRMIGKLKIMDRIKVGNWTI